MSHEQQIYIPFSSHSYNNYEDNEQEQNQSEEELNESYVNKNGEFQSQEKSNNHHKRQGGQSFQCMKCEKKYFVKKSYDNHLRLHQLKYACEYDNCGKKFNLQSSLERHTRVHTKQQPFQCDYDQCDKKFNQKSNLNRHKKIHKNQKKFICNKCCKKFTTSTNLKQHQNIHAPSKEERKFYNCEVQGCDKKYLYMCNLKKHVKDHTDPLAPIIGDNNPNEWTFSLSVVSCKIKIVVDIDSPQNLNKDHSQSKITFKEISGVITYKPDQILQEGIDLDSKIQDLLYKAKGTVSLSIELHPSLQPLLNKIIERIIAFNNIVGSKSIIIKIKDYNQFVKIITFLLKNYGPEKEQKQEFQQN